MDNTSTDKKYNLDFAISRVFHNPRLTSNIKNTVKLRLYETDEFINRYNLTSFFSGSSTFEEIESNIPSDIKIHDKEYTADKLKHALNNFSSIRDSRKIETKAKDKIYYLINEKFDRETGVFTYYYTDPPTNLSDSEKCIEHYPTRNNAVPKVWINTLCTFALIKWQLYSGSIDPDLKFTIEKAIEWLNENREEYGWKEFCKETGNIIKLFETSVTLQALLRASTLKYELHELDLEYYVQKILDLQEISKDGSWPSELDMIEENSSEQNIKFKPIFSGAVGATSCAIHFLDEYLSERKGSKFEKKVLTALESAYHWMLNQQINGCWMKNGTASVEYTTNALQALMKCGKRFDYPTDLNGALKEGLQWVGDAFCLELNNDIIYAWPKDDDSLSACERNTAYTITTLLKAGLPNDSFTIRKAMLWLLDNHPHSEFDEVYIYCAMLEYIKSLSPGYKGYFDSSEFK